MSTPPPATILDDHHPVEPKASNTTSDNTVAAEGGEEVGKTGDVDEPGDDTKAELDVDVDERERNELVDATAVGATISSEEDQGVEEEAPPGIVKDALEAEDGVDSEDEVDGNLGDAGIHSKQESESSSADLTHPDDSQPAAKVIAEADVVEGEGEDAQSETGEGDDLDDPSEAAPSEVVEELEEGDNTALEPGQNGSIEGDTIRPEPDADAVMPAESSSDAASTLKPSSFVRAPSATGITTTLVSSAPKKFSAVNLNKKFLGKTGSPSPTSPASGVSALGSKPGGGLGGLGSTPSSSSRILTSSKLTKSAKGTTSSTITPSTSIPGWNKPITPTSTGTGKGTGDLASADISRSSSLTGMSLGTKKSGGLVSSSGPASGSALNLKKEKKGWGNVPLAGAGPSGSSRDFPTASEVIEGQRQATQNAQLLAQAQAAHTRALLQGLDSFRGANRDPNAHYWDEDDEDMSFDQVLDFGDGTTYTIPAIQPIIARHSSDDEGPDPVHNEPVSKEERFQEDFDRSWPPKAPALPMPPPPQKKDLDSAAAARVLFNERSNKMEPPAERARKSHPAAPQLLSRSSKEPKPSERSKDRTPSTVGAFERAPPPHLPASREPERPKDIISKVPSPGATSSSRLPPRGSLLDRALPPHMSSDKLPPSSKSVSDQRQPIEIRRAGPPPGGFSDRPLPPHMANKQDDRQAQPLGRTRSRDAAERRPSDENNHGGGLLGRVRSRDSADAGQNRAGITSNTQTTSRHPSLSPTLARATAPPGLFSETSQLSTSLAAVPPTATDVNITEMQKTEMHTAAERARARREAEEAEREAAKNRAKQKAKELEDRLKAASAASVAVAIPAPGEFPGTLLAPPGLLPPQQTVKTPNAPTLLQRPAPPSMPVSFDRPMARMQDPLIRPHAERQLPPHLLANQAPPPNGYSSASAKGFLGQGRNEGSTEGLSVVYSSERDNGQLHPPFSSTPGIDGKSIPPPGLAPTSPTKVRTERPEALAAAALRSVRSDRTEESSWRKSAPVASKVAELNSKVLSVPAALLQSVEPTRQENIVEPRGLGVDDSTPASTIVASAAEANTAPGGSKSAARDSTSFEAILARIKAAMADDNPKAVLQEAVAQLEGRSSFNVENKSVPQERLMPKVVEAAEPPPSPPIVPQPRPNDFLTTQSSMPDAERLAWNTQPVKLPKSSPSSSRPSTHHPSSAKTHPVPDDFLVSWDPPLSQLSPVSMSRDEMLIGQQYHRGKLVTIVKLPTAKLQRVVKVQESPSKEAEIAKPRDVGPQQITVKLPGVAPKAKAVTRPEVRPSVEDLPAPALVKTTTVAPTQISGGLLLSRQKSPRKPDMAVSFANPLPEAKSSVRFFMESQLDEVGDSELLNEILSTEQEAIDVSGGDGLSSKNDVKHIDEVQNVLSGQKDFTPIPSSSMSNRVAVPASPPAAKSTKTLYPISQSPGRQLAGVDKAHIKSVWSSQPTSEVGATSSTNSLRGIADDLPQFSMPMAELLETRDDRGLIPDRAHLGPALLTPQEELDIPQFASVSVAPVLPLEPSTTGSSGFTGFPNGYQASQASYATASNASTEPRSSTQNHAYPSFPANTALHVQSNIPTDSSSGQSYSYPQSASSPNYGMGNYAADHMGHSQQLASGYLNGTAVRSADNLSQGLMSSHSHGGQQSGMWMPVAQHQTAALQQNGHSPLHYTTQLSSNGSSIHKVAHMRPSGSQAHSQIGSSPSPLQYRPNLPGQGQDQYSGNMLYSNPNSGPLDSPVMSYANTRSYGNHPGQHHYSANAGTGYGTGDVTYGMPGQGQYSSQQHLQAREGYQQSGNHAMQNNSRTAHLQMQLQQSTGGAAVAGYGLAVGSLSGQSRLGYDNANQHGHSSGSYRANAGAGSSANTGGGYGSVGAIMGANTGAGSYLGHGQNQSGNRSTAAIGGMRGGNGVIGGVAGNRRAWG